MKVKDDAFQAKQYLDEHPELFAVCYKITYKKSILKEDAVVFTADTYADYRKKVKQVIGDKPEHDFEFYTVYNRGIKDSIDEDNETLHEGKYPEAIGCFVEDRTNWRHIRWEDLNMYDSTTIEQKIISSFGEAVGNAVISTAKEEAKQMSVDEFLNNCVAKGGKWGDMFLSGIKKVFPKTYNAMPDKGLEFNDIMNVLTLCGVSDSNTVTDSCKRHIKDDLDETKFNAWIGNLGKYNEGILQGEWVAFPIDEDEFNAILKEKVGINKYYEEWACFDYEDPMGWFYDNHGEYASYKELNDYGEFIDNLSAHEFDAVKNILETGSFSSPQEAYDAYDNGDAFFYEGVDTEEELGELVIDNYYGEIPEELLERYFDYEALGRDLDYDSYETDDDKYVSAGEYFCGDENATDYEIGEAFVEEVGFAGVANPENYFDYEAFGRDLTYEDFTFTSDGCVEII